MSNIVYITTDTDGLVKHTKVCDATIKYFPNLLKLSYIGNVRKETYVGDYVGQVPERITEINGIDRALLDKEGMDKYYVADTIDSLFVGEPTIVTNNVKFHRLVLEAFMHIMGRKLPDATWIDIQELYRPICKLQSKKGTDYKFPKLSEVLIHLKDNRIKVPGQQAQIDIIEAAHKNWEVLSERAKKEDEQSCY